MKRIISIILALVILLVPVTAFAVTDEYDPKMVMMGDMNKDGKVSASDARAALRCAAKLDSVENVDMLSVDADGDNRISASDARAILRVSAKLSRFTNGFDGDGNPCVLNTLRSNVYSIDVSNYDELKDVNLDFIVARKNDNVYMMTDDENMMNELGMGSGSLNITKCGMMIADKKIYALMGTSSAEIAMYLSPDIQKELDMDSDSLYEIVDMISTLIPEDIGMPVLTQIDGKNVYCYTYSTVGQQCQLFISETGKLMRIDGVLSNGDIKTLLNFNEISGDTPDNYFDLNNFDEIW